MLCDGTGYPFGPRAIFPRTKSGVTGDLPAVVEALPIADLAANDYAVFSRGSPACSTQPDLLTEHVGTENDPMDYRAKGSRISRSHFGCNTSAAPGAFWSWVRYRNRTAPAVLRRWMRSTILEV